MNRAGGPYSVSNPSATAVRICPRAAFDFHEIAVGLKVDVRGGMPDEARESTA